MRKQSSELSEYHKISYISLNVVNIKSKMYFSASKYKQI